jgi:hypothetical protein
MTATEIWHAWQVKLADAQQALSEFEANLGTLAQTESAGALATKLTLLRNAVDISLGCHGNGQTQRTRPEGGSEAAAAGAGASTASRMQCQGHRMGRKV